MAQAVHRQVLIDAAADPPQPGELTPLRSPFTSGVRPGDSRERWCQPARRKPRAGALRTHGGTGNRWSERH
jgi:hypothetical protein